MILWFKDSGRAQLGNASAARGVFSWHTGWSGGSNWLYSQVWHLGRDALRSGLSGMAM